MGDERSSATELGTSIYPDNTESPQVPTKHLDLEAETRDKETKNSGVRALVDQLSNVSTIEDVTHIDIVSVVGSLCDLSLFNPELDTNGKPLDPTLLLIQEHLWPNYIEKRRQFGLKPEIWSPERSRALKQEVVKILSPGSFMAHGAYTADLDMMLRLGGLASPTTRETSGQPRESSSRWTMQGRLLHPDASAIFFFPWNNQPPTSRVPGSSDPFDPRGAMPNMTIIMPAETVVRSCRAISVSGQLLPDQRSDVEIGVTNSVKSIVEGKLVYDPDDHTVIPVNEAYFILPQEQTSSLIEIFKAHGYEEDWIRKHVLPIEIHQVINPYGGGQLNDMEVALHREKSHIDQWLAQYHQPSTGVAVVKRIWSADSSERIFTADIYPEFPQITATAEPTAPDGAHLIIDPELNKASQPYRVSFDNQLFTSLLRESGYPPNKIRDLKVRIRRCKYLSPAGPYGEYDKRHKEIIIYTDRLWEEYLRALDVATKLTMGKIKPHGSEFEYFLKTKRLAKYLSQVSPDRSLPFASKLLFNSMNKMAGKHTLHEAKHAIDFATAQGAKLMVGEFVTIALLTAFNETSLLGGFYLIERMHLARPGIFEFFANPLISAPMVAVMTLMTRYFFSPTENNARRFARILARNPKWVEIIKLSPRNPEDTPLGRLKASGFRWETKPLYGYEGYQARRTPDDSVGAKVDP